MARKSSRSRKSSGRKAKRKSTRKKSSRKKSGKRKVSLRNMTRSQLKRKGIRLRPNGDVDGDGVRNKDDCRPFNPKRQGILHRLELRRLQNMEERFERKREKELRKLEDIKDSLRMKQKVVSRTKDLRRLRLEQKQAVIDEITRERRNLRGLKRLNARAERELLKASRIGRISTKTITGSRKVLSATKAFLKSPKTQEILRNLERNINKL